MGADAPPVGPRLDEVSARTPAPACTPGCFGFRNHTPESPALPMQSPAVSRSRHLTVCGGVSVCGRASVSGRHASGLCIKYSFPIDAPPVGPRLDEVSAHTPAPACTPRCFGYRNHTPESPALPMQSPAVSRSRHPGDFFSVIAVIGCRESRPTALMLPRFFVQRHIFSVSPSSFSLSVLIPSLSFKLRVVGGL